MVGLPATRSNAKTFPMVPLASAGRRRSRAWSYRRRHGQRLKVRLYVGPLMDHMASFSQQADRSSDRIVTRRRPMR